MSHSLMQMKHCQEEHSKPTGNPIGMAITIFIGLIYTYAISRPGMMSSLGVSLISIRRHHKQRWYNSSKRISITSQIPSLSTKKATQTSPARLLFPAYACTWSAIPSITKLEAKRFFSRSSFVAFCSGYAAG